MNKILAALCLFPLTVFAADTLSGAKQQVRTGAKNDVQTQISDQGGTNLLNVVPNNSADPGGNTGGAQVVGGKVSTTAPSYTNGDLAMPWIGTDGRTQTQMSTTQLPATLGPQTSANSTSVTIASDQAAISVKSGAASGAATAVGTQTTIASGATTAIACASSLATATPTKLFRIRASGAALARCTARYNNNGTFTNVGLLMTSATKPTDEINFPDMAPASMTTGSTGLQQWEISCNNFDNASQDFNVDCSYCVSATGC